MAARPRVLLVDDNDDIRLLLRFSLADDFELTEIASAAEALDRIRNGETFDLVITDVIQPGMNGIEFTSVLREEHPELPVVVLSAWVDKKNAKIALDAGAAAAVAKPFAPADLVDTLKRLLAADGA